MAATCPTCPRAKRCAARGSKRAAPQPAAGSDNLPRTTDTLVPGDIVWTAFQSGGGADGDQVAQLLTTAALLQGTTFGVLRYAQNQSPTTAVPLLRAVFAITQDIPVGTSIRVHVTLPNLELRLLDGTTIVATSSSPTGWPASSGDVPDTSFLFAEPAFRVLHAVGYTNYAGQAPVYGVGLVNVPNFVTLQTPTPGPGPEPVVYASITQLVPLYATPRWRNVAEQQYLLKDETWTTSLAPWGPTMTGVQGLVTLIPKPGALAFIGVFVGDQTPTELRLVARQTIPEATVLSFTTEQFVAGDTTFMGAQEGFFTYTTPSDISYKPGTVFRFQLYLLGGAPTVDVSVRRPTQNGAFSFAPQDAGIVTNAVVGNIRAMTQWTVYSAGPVGQPVAAIGQLTTIGAVGTDRPYALWSPDVMNQAVWPRRSVLLARQRIWGGAADREVLSLQPVTAAMSLAPGYLSNAL